MHPAVAAYEAAYTTTDTSQIDALVAQAFTEDGKLLSPWIDGAISGQSALADHIRLTRARIEGTTSRHTSALEGVGNTLRWTWAFEVDGERVAEGMDVVVLGPDEKISLLIVFDGAAPPAL